MFGLGAYEESLLHEKIAWAILVQSLPIFLILCFVIPGACVFIKVSLVVCLNLRLIYSFLHLYVTFSAPLFLARFPWLVFCFQYVAPWGKTISYSFGPLLPARISWFFFESPNLMWSYLCWWNCQHQLPVSNLLLLILFSMHYVQRAVLYPMRMSPNTTPMPLTVVVVAFCFTSFNG